jgi:hypothetical protein
MVDDIRNAINIPEDHELSDDVVNNAIYRSKMYVGALRLRYGAPAHMFTALDLHYSIYLAYQSYSDRVLNVQPGAYVEGKFEPITEEIVRSTGDKLQGLQKVVSDLVDLIKSYPLKPLGIMRHWTAPDPVFGIGQMNYGSITEI